MKTKKGKCPLCRRTYTGINPHTSHHIFYPKKEYYRNIKIDMCSQCHCEFNNRYKFIDYPTELECLMNFLRFVDFKEKNALELYPQLLREL